MTDHRLDGPLDDAALGREIEQALSVEPSPEFVARVRTRVASEGTPRSGYGLGWWALLAGGGAVVAAVLVAVYVGLNLSREPSPNGPVAAVARSTSDDQRGRASVRSEAPKLFAGDGRPPDGASSSAPPAKGASGVRAQANATVARRGPDAFPEVMVSASEVLAVRQLLAMAQGGGIETTEALATPDSQDMPGIVIEPIRIAPIELVRLGEAE